MSETMNRETTNGAKIVRMANQIAAFFRSYPEEEAIEGVRNHIHSFWTPRMVAQLRDEAGSDALDALARAALDRLPASRQTA